MTVEERLTRLEEHVFGPTADQITTWILSYLTQSDCADDVGVDKSYISKIMSGAARPGAKIVRKMREGGFLDT